MIRTINAASRVLSASALVASALLLVAIMVIGAADVVSTQFLSGGVPGAVELSEAMLAVLVFLGLPQVQRMRGHIAIDLLTTRLGDRPRRWLLAFTSLIELLFFGLIAWGVWALTLRSLAIDEQATGYLAFPVYPAKALTFLGAALATLEVARQVVALMVGLVSGDNSESGLAP